jgi:hypothetical protein
MAGEAISSVREGQDGCKPRTGTWFRNRAEALRLPALGVVGPTTAASSLPALCRASRLRVDDGQRVVEIPGESEDEINGNW